MRRRFFITIFIVLAVTAASVSGIHFRFFKQERLRLIELNLQQNATLIAESDLNLFRKGIAVHPEDVISGIIGDDKINIIVAIYDEATGSLLYENENAQIFDLPDQLGSDTPVWEDVEQKDYFIKYLTHRDEAHGRIVRVGMILNQSLIRWKDLNQRIFLFVGIILVVIAIISFFLTYLLFRPVHKLAEHVNLMGEKLEDGKFEELALWFKQMPADGRPSDEFNSLLNSLDKLANRILDTQQMTQRWSALMAHELKTPMTRLRMSIEKLLFESKCESEHFVPVEEELKKLETIVMDFLEWASVENDSSRPEIHAVNIPERINKYLQLLRRGFPNVSFYLEDLTTRDYRVFCNPLHFDQVLSNVLTNSAKYGGKTVNILCEDGKLTVQDNGPGIPEKVLKNFGKPFNKYSREGVSGHGLGLAWVSTIANKYGWKISVSNLSGSKLEIIFP